jgi:hypothetical protein
MNSRFSGHHVPILAQDPGHPLGPALLVAGSEVDTYKQGLLQLVHGCFHVQCPSREIILLVGSDQLHTSSLLS